MDKVVRDGKVAVLYASGYGLGWYSYYGDPKMAFDPDLVALVEAADASDDSDSDREISSRMRAEIELKFPGADSSIRLGMEWVPVGAGVRIRNHDGLERIEYLGDGVLVA